MASPMTAEEKKTVAHVLALIETVQEAGPEGAPAGPCYMAFMMHGLDMEAFNNIVAIAKKCKMIEERGHVYYAVKVR